MILYILAVLLLVVFLTLLTISCIKNDENMFYAAHITVAVGVLLICILVMIVSSYLNHFSDFPITTEKETVEIAYIKPHEDELKLYSHDGKEYYSVLYSEVGDMTIKTTDEKQRLEITTERFINKHLDYLIGEKQRTSTLYIKEGDH